MIDTGHLPGDMRKADGDRTGPAAHVDDPARLPIDGSTKSAYSAVLRFCIRTSKLKRPHFLLREASPFFARAML